MAKIYNTFEQLAQAKKAGLPHVAVIPVKTIGREPNSNRGVCVYAPFDSRRWEGPWFDNGRKVFSSFDKKGNSQERLLAAAQDAFAWIAAEYGYTGEWRRNKMRDWVPAEVAKRFKIGTEVEG